MSESGAVEDRLIERCRAVVGARHVALGDEMDAERLDWTGKYGGAPACIARPATTAEVVELVRVCGELGVGIVPQGGNTGLVGATAAPAGTLLMSLRRLDRIDDVDLERGRVTAEAGVTLAALHDRVRASAWRYAVDFGARASATIGGTIATNAGGVHVMRFGSTREQVVGLEWVTAGGAVIGKLPALDKDNAGYDLTTLMIGSEGTLGIVTRAELRLVRRPRELVTAMIGCASLGDAVDIAWAVRRDDPGVEVIELIDGPCLELVGQARGWASPVGPCGAALLIESAGDSADPAATLAAALERHGAVTRVAVASSEADRSRFWSFRDDITSHLAPLGQVAKFDVSVSPGALRSFALEIAGIVATADETARTWCFGHVADANLHVNVTHVAGTGSAIEERVLSEVIARGGSIAAEHGIGRAKTRWLAEVRSEAELAAMRAIKAALDPHEMFNPGVVPGAISSPRGATVPEPPARP